jgi:xanthine dehydrogenase accessory factor
MLVASGGGIVGSVSAGCVESAVIAACHEVMQTGQLELLHFGVADDEAWEVGMACGGEIDVLVEPLTTTTGDYTPHWWLFPTLCAALQAEEPLILATVLAATEDAGTPGARLLAWPDGRRQGSLGTATLDDQACAVGLALLPRQDATTRTYEHAGGEVVVLIEAFGPPPTLLIVGATHIAIALVQMARTAGFRTVVTDARQTFATPERFPHVDELVSGWPDEVLPARLSTTSYVVVLTHDPKLDDPALTLALTSAAPYVGALGSQRTTARRKERMQAAGMSTAQLARLHAPIGLQIGARTPEEIALSILAEIVAVRREGALAGRVPPP